MSAPELSVVCGSCGSEVSPYVTECPYCGTRLRKRAPKLERQGDEIRVHESRRERRKRLRRERGERRRPRVEPDGKPVATIAVLAAGAALLVVAQAADLGLEQVGAIVGPIGGELWRYVTAPFVYDDVGYLFVVGLAIAIFGVAVERRIGTVATLLAMLACGTLGMLAADAAAAAGLDDFLIAAGGNGIALGMLGAWLALRRAEASSELGDAIDVAGVIVAALVLLLLPLLERSADPIAGVVGGLVGFGLGALAASRGQLERV